MERRVIGIAVDGSTGSLADVGLFAGVQGKECVDSTVDGKHLVLGCKYNRFVLNHPPTQTLCSFHATQNHS